MIGLGWVLSCTTKPTKNYELGDVVIDPNAVALPAEEVPKAPGELVGQPEKKIEPKDEVRLEPEKPEPEKLIEQPQTIEKPASAEIPVLVPSVVSTPGVASKVPVLTEPSPEASAKVLGSGKQVRFIKADQLYIRSKPDRTSRSIGVVRGGEEVHVTIQGGWAKLDDGRWIRSRWLVKKRPKQFEGNANE